MNLPELAWPTLGGKQLWADVSLHSGYRVQRNVWTGHHRLLGPLDGRHTFGSRAECEQRLDALRERVPPMRPHLVLCLHGIFRSKDAFRPLVQQLRAAGLEAHAVNYASTRRSLEDSADDLDDLLDGLVGVERLTVVGHSLGGLLGRVLLGRPAAWRARVAVNGLVTIGTPHQGAELVQLLSGSATMRAIGGPSGLQLLPSISPNLPIPAEPVATIAGVRGDGSGWNPLLPGDDDMTVSEASTHLPGEVDHLRVNAVHTFVHVQREVGEAVLRFAETQRLSG